MPPRLSISKGPRNLPSHPQFPPHPARPLAITSCCRIPSSHNGLAECICIEPQLPSHTQAYPTRLSVPDLLDARRPSHILTSRAGAGYAGREQNFVEEGLLSFDGPLECVRGLHQ